MLKKATQSPRMTARPAETHTIASVSVAQPKTRYGFVAQACGNLSDTSRIPIGATTALDVEDLTVDEDWIDPSRPSLKLQLLEKLRIAPFASIEKMRGCHGGQNMGLWTIQDGSRSLVVKMVTHTRFMGLPTEAEVFADLARTHPQLVGDDSIAFPVKIFTCTGTGNVKRDLIVMEKADGECFATMLMRKCNENRAKALQDLAAFGAFLCSFHRRHGLQHGDCNPANVMYHAATGEFKLIDVADVGNPRIKKKDVQHFCDGLTSIMKHHGQSFCEEARRNFESGYSHPSSGFLSAN
jgi:aminoglycoside phosphotransferase (APT) family kinase protein